VVLHIRANRRQDLGRTYHGGDWTALAAQAAAAETVAKDCSDAVSTRRLAAGSTNSLWLRKKSTPIMVNETSARRNVHSNRRP
jgi:hypothetical protein